MHFHLFLRVAVPDQPSANRVPLKQKPRGVMPGLLRQRSIVRGGFGRMTLRITTLPARCCGCGQALPLGSKPDLSSRVQFGRPMAWPAMPVRAADIDRGVDDACPGPSSRPSTCRNPPLQVRHVARAEAILMSPAHRTGPMMPPPPSRCGARRCGCGAGRPGRCAERWRRGGRFAHFHVDTCAGNRSVTLDHPHRRAKFIPTRMALAYQLNGFDVQNTG